MEVLAAKDDLLERPEKKNNITGNSAIVGIHDCQLNTIENSVR